MQREPAIFQNFEVALPLAPSIRLYLDVMNAARKLQLRRSLSHEFPVHINFRVINVASYCHLAMSRRRRWRSRHRCGCALPSRIKPLQNLDQIM